MMSPFAVALVAACLLASPSAAQPVLDRSSAAANGPAGAIAIPVYGKANPGKAADEVVTNLMGREIVLRNITYPTLTPVLPRPGTGNGSAVIVAPGGGFMMLSMQNEGWRVAQALADTGVTAFVLKYRLNPTPKNDNAFLIELEKLLRGIAKDSDSQREVKDSGAASDALAALKLVRARAGDWGIDPHRVGMIGFSAGAITAIKTVLEADADGDPATLPPDFFGYIYGPMAAVAVPKNAPPMFAALAMDDPLFGKGDFSIASAWHAAERPVELHVYQKGGHGFGLGQPNTTSTQLMPEFLAWMDMQGLLKPKAKP
jgi:acetyl esterase/lipase